MRFPALAVFFLQELRGYFTSCSLRLVCASSSSPVGKPVAVELIPERATVELEDRPPTLYPMLLLLSKFRVDEDLERHEEEGASTEGMSAKQIADLSLFFLYLHGPPAKPSRRLDWQAGAMAALTPSMEAADSIKKTLEKLSRQDLSTFTIFA